MSHEIILIKLKNNRDSKETIDGTLMAVEDGINMFLYLQTKSHRR